MNRTISLERSLEILVPPKWSNDEKGAYLEDIARRLLTRQSYEVSERIRFTGMEIDLLAKHKPSSDLVYVECKFLSSTVGANAIDLMLAQAWRRQLKQLALFSIGPLSKEALGVVEDLKVDSRISFSFYGKDALLEALIDSSEAPNLRDSDALPSISHATLLVHPEHPYIWLLQDQKDGRPFRIIPYAPSAIHRPSPTDIRQLLDTQQILEGLPVVEYLDSENKDELKTASLSSNQLQPTEVVGPVVIAETILDPRPCRPEDFVGRLDLQKEIWDFLAQVRSGVTNTRLIALVGASGYGKSSLVSKLAERFRNIKWKKRHFLFPVDVRSARGPLFVAEALLQGIRNASDAGFLELPDDLRVTDADNILASESIQQVLATLERERKLLIIFFDQFEEILTKDELQPVFRVFRRFALDVHSKHPNLIIGFSWRTGISFSEENQAYHLWNELRDYRITKTVGTFDIAESSRLISQFEQKLGLKLLPPLRRRIIEQGQGLPWLLKKLCIHMHGQITSGVSQTDLLGSRLNVQALFDEDLEHLTEGQLSCLRFVASNSPVDVLDVFERYGPDIVNTLSTDKRLIIRTGQRFAIYWDVFRDYLSEGKVPAIPWTYIPNCPLVMVLPVCTLLATHGQMAVSDLARELAYSEATILNIITDLQNAAICAKEHEGKHFLLDMLSVPDRIRSQFIEHVLYRRLLEHAGESGVLSRTAAIEIVRALYSSADVKLKTRDNYLARVLSWLEYAGLAEADGHNIIVYPPSRHGEKFGYLPISGGSSRGPFFIASATPEDSEALLLRVEQSGKISQDLLIAERLRNPAQDLVALGLARWSNKNLVPTTRLGKSPSPRDAFARAVNESAVFVLFSRLLSKNSNLSRTELGALLAAELGRDWRPSSCLRYTNGLHRYRDYLTSDRTTNKKLLSKNNLENNEWKVDKKTQLGLFEPDV